MEIGNMAGITRDNLFPHQYYFPVGDPPLIILPPASFTYLILDVLKVPGTWVIRSYHGRLTTHVLYTFSRPVCMEAVF